VVFTAGALRMAGVLGLVLFVVFHVRRSFENKDVEYILSRPISRVSFILSHAAAFCFLAILTGLVIAFVVMGQMPHGLYGRIPIWAVSIIAEFVIMVNVALFFSMVLSSATTGVLASLALYMLARLMGELLGIADHEMDSHMLKILGVVMQGISLIVPRLDLMGQTSWLIYGDAGIGYGFILAQTAVYSGLVLSAAIVDLVRRQF
jgi:hypothetical protein